ncbi:MAG: BlaI/MecI/CopY family transcriptional regulator [Thermoguttaceae bacterium]
MPRQPSSTPTEVELAILDVLWRHGPSTVRQIHDTLDRPDKGLSTTLKMVQVMTDKGLLVRQDTVRPQVFRPAQSQEQTQTRILDDLIQRAFGGSAAKLVQRVTSARRLAPQELAEIKKLIDSKKGGPP